MAVIIGVRFKEVSKIYYFDPDGKEYPLGELVIVETTRGVECGTVAIPNREVPDESITKPLKRVVRKASKEDRRRIEENHQKEKRAYRICQEKIAANKLEMKLVGVEYTFDNSKILFYFTADGRVDFRELVKDLASVFRTRIELRQIGVRDEAKMLGGLGICGRPFCCSSFLGEFQPVSIKMAKEQGLSLNPTKISGTCGRLMCCLKYEQEAYEDLVKRAPKQESFVETPDGAGTVSGVNLLRQTSQVRLESDPESPRTYHNCELCVIRSGKGKRPEGYVEPPLEELAKRRRQEEGGTALVSEEDSLAAAIEAAFPSRGPREEQHREEREDRRPNRRSRRRHPRGEGGEPKHEAEGAGERKPREEGGDRRPNRRRRHRPKGGGGKPSGPQE